jgi:hypothetical protein
VCLDCRDAEAFEPKPDNIAVAQLVHLHADLGGRLLACQAQASRLASDMRHVEAVIRMFDPTYDVRRIAVKRRRKKNPWFKRGHMFRAARGWRAIGDTGISGAALGRSGLHGATLAQIRNMTGALRPTLDNHAGKTAERVGEGMPARWVLARDDEAPN